MVAIIMGTYTVPSFLLVFVGYNVFSSLLQYLFYYRRAGEARAWKIQPAKTGGLGDPHWWIPIMHSHRASKDRHPLHGVFATVRASGGGRASCRCRPGWLASYLLTCHQCVRAMVGWLVCQVNLAMASTFAAVTAEGTARGVGSRLHSQPIEGGGMVGQQALLLLVALVWQSVLEYVWHIGE